MTERHFAPGEVIYREGDPSDFAYFIKSGKVEILKREADGLRQVTVLGKGDVFGEMGIVLDQRRSVTVRALAPVVVRAISRTGFLAAVNQHSEAARPVLKTLLARLHEQDEAAQPERPVATPRMPEAATPRLRLLPASERLARLLRRDGVEITRLPFRIGRLAAPGKAVPAEENDLAIEDTKPYNLSRRHLLIERTERVLVVRDLGSQLGTKVNGIRIGGPAPIHVASLLAGDNEIIAGGETSPFRFTLRVESTG
ncbi:MAG TPA: cyclic nucleotide-binding domain-containing protein [Alphaproteobacteria bacterium]|nr:cyclic nucleotide-binding domain-containing protein [Alphaproteobacteria bacterium]